MPVLWQIDVRASLLTLLKSESPWDLPTELYLHFYMFGEDYAAPFKPCPYCETCKRIGYQMPGPQPVYARGALDGSADWNLSSE